jgi:hypothetical protein
MLDATPLLRTYARWRMSALTRRDAVVSQREQLFRLLSRAKDTRFGREHGFEHIRDVTQFQRAVQLRRYDDFWNEYWATSYPVLDNITWPGVIPFFAASSGTSTGVTKHIPVSAAMVASNKRAAIDVLVHHVINRPESRIFGGRNFMLGGSTALKPVSSAIGEGDLSGIAAARVPLWAKPYYFPSGALAQITDWERKTAVLAEASLAADIRSISGTPSWLLPFFDELNRLKPGTQGRLVDFYPNLELLVHGGVSFEPYRSRFEALLEGSHAETREVYPASEGFIAFADRGPGEGLRLVADNGLFFEFVPLEELDSERPTRHWLETAEVGVNYAVVLSTCAGLWSYVLGDTVRFVEKDPPRILVTGRTSYSLSAFGEHLIGEEIDAAVSAAAEAISASIADFMVGPVFPDGRPGHHLYLVEFTSLLAQDRAGEFTHVLDRELSLKNVDYAEHRSGGHGMGAPEALFLPPGSFAAWMKSRGKLGGQNKVPRVIADATAFLKTLAHLRDAVRERVT